jgi:hypothetical protein
MDRRAFFRGSAAAVVAAPVAAKQIAGEVMRNGGGPIPPFGAAFGRGLSTAAGETSSPGHWLKQELKEYTERLAGLDKDKPQYDRNWHPIASQNIDGLRSVSPVNKARMAVEVMEAMERARERSWIERRIDELKKQLGPLGDLI